MNFGWPSRLVLLMLHGDAQLHPFSAKELFGPVGSGDLSFQIAQRLTGEDQRRACWRTRPARRYPLVPNYTPPKAS